jgi:hypothetical protein
MNDLNELNFNPPVNKSARGRKLIRSATILNASLILSATVRFSWFSLLLLYLP